VPSGTPLSYGKLTFEARPPLWNLLAIGLTQTPSQFNRNVGDPTGGVAPPHFESLWAWNAALGKWYFYSPHYEQPGELFTSCEYATSNNYLCFDTPTLMPLGPGIGFWVYRP